MNDQFDDELSRLAMSIVLEASEADLGIKLDCFKALTSYRLGMAKIEMKQNDSEDGDNIANFAKRIKDASRG